MVLQVFGVSSFWGKQAGFSLVWFYSPCHLRTVLITFKTNPCDPFAISFVIDFIVVNNCLFWFYVNCIFSAMVREEQCGFLPTLFFQGLFLDCLRARTCCAFICFRHGVAVLPLWPLALWPTWPRYGFDSLVSWFCMFSSLMLLLFCFLWIWEGSCFIPYVVAFSVAPLLGEQPRGYGTGRCSPSLSLLGLPCYSAEIYVFPDMYPLFISNVTFVLSIFEFSEEKPCGVPICWQLWCL